jgi:glycine hydroxymethyltransferase
VAIERDELLWSLEQQRRRLAASIVLTPVDSLPFSLTDREHTGFLHGLYLTDNVRDRDASKNAVIQFGGRQQAAHDLVAIHDLLAETFGAAAGSLRLLSGLHAHAATFMSIAAIGQSVLLLPVEGGGHFNTHAILERLGLRTIDVPIDYAQLCVNRMATHRLVEREQPDFIFIDRSDGLRYEDFSFIGEIQGPIKIFDASQYVPQIVTGWYENPFTWGFDLMLFSLHKSFPGPQKAAIVTRTRDEVWTRLLAGLAKLVSSSHAESSYLAALTFLRKDWLDIYVARLLGTSAALEKLLWGQGLPVFERAAQGQPHWPATHHVWIRSRNREEAFTQYERLADVNVHTNYRELPYRLGHGLRLGTSFSSVAGVDVVHMEELAAIIRSVIVDGASSSLRRRVRTLAEVAAVGAIVPAEHWR